ncbi:MAG TPA: hypothetical protein VII08_24845 [Myxococcales bacterium]
MRLVSTAVPALALALLSSGGARAARCTAIDATIATHFSPCSPDNLPNPDVGLCTAGTVDSGLLAGDTSFAAYTLTPTQVFGVYHYTGNLIITTASRDTLTIRDRGVLDMGKGKYFEFDKVVAGTGAFAGAKGMLTSQGDFLGTSFLGRLTGKVCRPDRHHDRHHDGDSDGDADSGADDDSADAEDGAAE